MRLKRKLTLIEKLELRVTGCSGVRKGDQNKVTVCLEIPQVIGANQIRSKQPPKNTI